MIIILGESASGKSSIEKELVNFYKFKKIVSYTTRQPRSGETDGIDYHFITDEKFKELIKNNFFAEYSVYRGWYYGTSKEDCISSNDKILVATPHGLRQFKKNKEIKIISFYINIPRRDRLIKILQRGDDIDESYRRNLNDSGQFDGIEDEVDYVIYNDGYKKTITQVTREVILNYANI